MVFYQIFLPSFADSNNDGVGDFRGVIEKFDYLLELGIEGIWVSPFHTSPTYHKYDVLDYFSIDPAYGDADDLKELLDLAHKNGVKVLMDLIVNHTSINHPWFQNAVSPRSEYHDYYIWRRKEEIDQLNKTSIEADSDNEIVWHDVEGSDLLYFAYFYSGMPELNYDNDRVRTVVLEIAKYWLDFGFDGFRIDAAKHIYEHTGETDKCVAWWEQFSSNLKNCYSDVLIFGEVWDSIHFQAQFSNAFDGMFNFEFSGILLDSLKNKEGQRFANELRRMVDQLDESGMSLCLFLSNHDMTRVRSVLKNDGLAKIAAFLLFLLKGDRFIYQGEELGQCGEKPDEHLREGFPWGDRYEPNWVSPKYRQYVKSVYIQAEMRGSMLCSYKELIEMNWVNFDVIRLPFKELFVIKKFDVVLIINFSAKEFDLSRYRLGQIKSFDIKFLQVRNF